MPERILIEVKLEHIYQETLQIEKDISLYNGECGLSLFGVLYSKHFRKNHLSSEIINNLQYLLNKSFDGGFKTLCSGKTGINWYFSYLNEIGYLGIEDKREVCSDDLILSKIALFWIEIGNFDFLHGALGIAYYLLKSKSILVNFFEKFFEHLFFLMKNKDNMIYHFDFNTFRPDKTRINLGLAHGITSILKFSVECYKSNICKERALDLMSKVTYFFLSSTNTFQDKSIFPSIIVLGTNINQASRLAWCYGDLTIAFVLYQAGVEMKDQKIIDFSLAIFAKSRDRRNPKENQVVDAGICHGTSGIAHIYNKMWKLTGHQKFKDECEFWIDETLNYGTYQDTISGFKKYDPVQEKYVASKGLLEGSAGIGLVLISFLTGDCSWDSCMMLDS
ncbi:hypothetical protein H9N25_17150 [Pedobacter riviphilus]|uniref:Lanthionine synthetase C-like protein n=1 Tax=Pedobacter riviphilus TaxID=2766984 RepID=A0ABX6TDU0_9SPHI|nr:lanthionine synthetase LanC family protein [Pedobacter riviphilus]QNR83656.1 hypothetical protein H9N25_17150 [Pedobacter riviphilus]